MSSQSNCLFISKQNMNLFHLRKWNCLKSNTLYILKLLILVELHLLKLNCLSWDDYRLTYSYKKQHTESLAPIT